MLKTEYEFILPKGYVDEDGSLHKEGVMRMATAADEILPLRDPRVQSNPAYLTIILLSRVVTKLGGLTDINPRIVEGLFASDLSYLQEFYRKINGDGTTHFKAVCPKCGNQFEVDMAPGE